MARHVNGWQNPVIFVIWLSTQMANEKEKNYNKKSEKNDYIWMVTIHNTGFINYTDCTVPLLRDAQLIAHISF